jgi:hypothetical protein
MKKIIIIVLLPLSCIQITYKQHRIRDMDNVKQLKNYDKLRVSFKKAS